MKAHTLDTIYGDEEKNEFRRMKKAAVKKLQVSAQLHSVEQRLMFASFCTSITDIVLPGYLVAKNRQKAESFRKNTVLFEELTHRRRKCVSNAQKEKLKIKIKEIDLALHKLKNSLPEGYFISERMGWYLLDCDTIASTFGLNGAYIERICRECGLIP